MWKVMVALIAVIIRTDSQKFSSHCEENGFITKLFERDAEYYLQIKRNFSALTTVSISFDKKADLISGDPSIVQIHKEPRNDNFVIRLREAVADLNLNVKGTDPAKGRPLISSVLIDSVEYCKTPNMSSQTSGPPAPIKHLILGGEGSGQWTEWGQQSPCSRSCGGGIASQKRQCLKAGSDGKLTCSGGDTRYIFCATTTPCPAGTDYIDEQCADFDKVVFNQYNHRWRAYVKRKNPCALTCIPAGERWYLTLRDKVIDGTRCNHDSVCINGVCELFTEDIKIVPKIAHDDDGCGRRKVYHNELIVNGSPTKPGDWPWHAAIYRFERSRIDYICGGTLVSNYFVLTAAHCVAIRGLVVLPETRNVVLGKYNLVGGDIAPQEKEVHKIILHKDFNGRTVARDIALLKLTTAVQFTDYVQPACLWYDLTEKPQKPIYGTVVGWGFDHSDLLSSTLQKVVLPEQTNQDCIKSNPLFFSQKLDEFKFCAGYDNGTSVCNGDSGGGYLVFVPDQPGDESPDATGAWHVKGIVSLSVKRHDAPICDPQSFALFTDVDKFADWIKEKLRE